MKEKGISRNVGIGQRRAPGDGPALGPLANTQPVSGGPAKGQRRRKRRSAEVRPDVERRQERERLIVLRWSLLSGFAGCVVLVGLFVFWLRPYMERRDRMAAIREKVEDEVPILQEDEVVRLGEPEGLELMRKVLAARTAGEVEEVADPGRTPVSEVVEYLSGLTEREGRVERLEWARELDTRDPGVAGVVVHMRKEGVRVNRLGLFAMSEDGKWRMDFAAFARLAEPSWEGILEGGVESVVARVFVAPDGYFNGPFVEADGWRCFGLASPDLPEMLFGYCRRDSAQFAAIRDLLSRKKLARAVLVLERVDGAGNRQFRIKRVLAADWLMGDVAADEREE